MTNFDRDFGHTLTEWKSKFKGYSFIRKTTPAGRHQVHVSRKVDRETMQLEELVCIASCAGGFCALLNAQEDRITPEGEDPFFLSGLTGNLRHRLGVV